MSSLPVTRPPYDAEAAPFWNAAAEGRLVLPVCIACGVTIWYPRTFCPVCDSPSVQWQEHAGTGVVYAITVIRTTFSPLWAPHTPFVVAYIELDHGPRLQANIITNEPDAVQVGARVEAVFVPLPADDELPAQAVLRFVPINPY